MALAGAGAVVEAARAWARANTVDYVYGPRWCIWTWPKQGSGIWQMMLQPENHSAVLIVTKYAHDQGWHHGFSESERWLNSKY
jgi:hypothetical protein